jgi:hypothetical protein
MTRLFRIYSCTGLRGGKYADVSNAAALRDLSKMYITYVPGLQDGTEVPKQLTRDVSATFRVY